MLTGKGNAKQTADQLPKIKSADQGLMIRSSVPEEPTGETDCCTCVLSQDNKIIYILSTSFDEILCLDYFCGNQD